MARFAQTTSILFLLAAPLHAQDALPQTPPELRDFRIEPERTQPEPTAGPEIRPTITAPPVTEPTEPQRSTAAPSDRPTQSPDATPNRRSTASAPSERQTSSSTSATPALIPPIGSTITDTPQAELNSDISAPPFAQDERSNSPLPVANEWASIALALSALLAMLFAGWFIWRRKHNEDGRIEDSLPIIDVPDTGTAPVHHAVNIRRTQAEQIRPHVKLEFRPERATLSFTALTVKGTIVIENVGKEAATDMLLRATMISAHHDQAATIDAFFNRSIAIEDNMIGDAKAGEKIALELEISIPSQELLSYTVAERQIIVPIVVAELIYRWTAGKDSTRLACLVGREAQPPQGRMGPLRLDLGPRSFGQLGQRSIHA